MLNVKYAVVSWLAIMTPGWVFGRHIIPFAGGQNKVSGKTVLWTSGAGLLIFSVVRGIGRYTCARRHSYFSQAPRSP